MRVHDRIRMHDCGPSPDIVEAEAAVRLLPLAWERVDGGKGEERGWGKGSGGGEEQRGADGEEGRTD